jgi:hypothetical protein
MSLLVLFIAFSIELYEILYNRDIPQQAVLVKSAAEKPVDQTHRLPCKKGYPHIGFKIGIGWDGPGGLFPAHPV